MQQWSYFSFCPGHIEKWSIKSGEVIRKKMSAFDI